MEHIYNVQKGRKRDENDGTPPQKKAKSSKLTYPELDHLMATNPVTFDRHKAALDGELQKSHPKNGDNTGANETYLHPKKGLHLE